ncbi:MAG TPA: Hsp20/alpha crystallin family protein, partial [Acidimicrobiales bacterium]|nr:Hsp20/alpha crystallin family protein [Acidimicrobiales bacterium]
MRFDPFQEFDRLTEGLSRGTSRYMPMDAYRRGDHVVVAFDLPGVAPDSIDLTVEKNVVTVRAERSWRPEEADQVILHERPQGEFTRRLFVGEG